MMAQNSHDNYPIRVLLVDDQAMIGESCKKFISEIENAEILYTTDPKEAMVKVLEFKPTVILQDLIMPEIEGMDLVRYYRAHSTIRHVPIIVLSSKEDAEIKAKAFSLGANDYMVKLPEGPELNARVKYHSKVYDTPFAWPVMFVITCEIVLFF